MMQHQCPKKVAAFLNFLATQEPKPLFEILNRLPKLGVGRKVTRNTWNLQDNSNRVRPAYWVVTQVMINRDLLSGEVLGNFTPRGSTCMRIRNVRSIWKKEWLLLPKNYERYCLNISEVDTTSDKVATTDNLNAVAASNNV